MSVNYSLPAINDRLQGVVTAIGANGYMLLRDGATTISSVQLASPVGTVNNGVLTFSGQMLDPAAQATGEVNNVRITDPNGVVMISGLTVGIPLSAAEVIISNGLNSTLISSGQTVSVLSVQITGS